MKESPAAGAERPPEEQRPTTAASWERPTAEALERSGEAQAVPHTAGDGPRTAAAAGITANPEATQEEPTAYVPPAAIRLEGESPEPTTWASSAAIALPAPSAVTARPVDLATSATTHERRRRPQLRTSATILLFLAGVAVGVVGLRLATSAPPPTPADGFPSLSRTTAEPLQAGAVARELAVNDVQGLAQLLDGDTLTALQTQLKPLVSFESVTFVGATTFDRDTLAGYVVRGRDQDGALGLVGLVIRLRDGQVVAQ